MKTIAYARVSNVEQSNNSNALEQQVERLKRAGASDIYIDIESGYKKKTRKQLDRMMELVRSRQVHEVIVTRFDRLSRNNKQAFSLIEEFVESGVILRALDEPFDLTTASGRMQVAQLAIYAQYRSDQQSESIKHGWKHLRRTVKAVKPPFGYTVIDSRYHADTEPFLCLTATQEERSRWQVAKEIVEAFWKTESLQGCIKEIHARYGISTHSHHHKAGGLFSRGLFRFSATGMKHWLLNPVLRGHTRYLQSETIYNTHKDKLLTDLQAKTIEKQIEHNRKVGGYGSKAPKYPLSGLIFCGECRSAYYSLMKCTLYYQCKNWRYRGCNQKKMVRADSIEQVVIAALIEKAIAITTIAQTSQSPTPNPELQKLQEKLAKLELMEYDPDIEEAKEKLQRRIEDMWYGVKVEESERGDRLELLQAFSEPIVWRAYSDEKKRSIYRALVDRVVVKDGEVVDVVLKV